jgi:mannosyltransferase OCH1-like enzyme
MHKYGGLYVDLDFECLRPLDDLLTQDIVSVGRERGGLGWYKRRLDYACNALLASPPGHPFWEFLLKRFVECARPKSRWESAISYVLSTTGPQILDITISDYLASNDDLRVYPHNIFYPASVLERNADSRRKLAKRKGSYAVHHSANSWFSIPMHTIMWLAYYLRRPFL